MAASPRDCPVACRDGGTRVPLGARRMAAVAFVDAIDRDLGDIADDLVELPGQDFAVAPGGGDHFDADDVLGGFFYVQVNLAPGVALANSVLTHCSMVGFAQPTGGSGKPRFPKPPFRSFAFTDDLPPGGLDHHGRRPLTPAAPALQRKLSGTSRPPGVICHRQIPATQAQQRLDQSFCRAVRHRGQGPYLQEHLHRRTRIPGFAAFDRMGRCPTVPDTRLVEPDPQIGSIDQRALVLRPFRHPIPLLEACLASLRLHPRCRADLRAHPHPPHQGSCQDTAPASTPTPFLLDFRRKTLESMFL